MIALIGLNQFDQKDKEVFLKAVADCKKELDGEIAFASVIVEGATQGELNLRLTTLCDVSGMDFDFYVIEKPKPREELRKTFSELAAKTYSKK